MSQALYRKWRPQTWDAVIGQEHIVQTLRNALAAGRVAHAYLFAGPRGTGKTTTARLLAKAVNCLEEDLTRRPCGQCDHCQAVNAGRFLDLIEIDAASNTSVEDVRDLRDKINFSPNQGKYKVYIVDEVHMLSTAAFNALLKTLEEPPEHAIFILATTEVHKIPATVLSRCQRHEFRRIPIADIVANLRTLARGEGIQVEPEALTLVARQSTGAMRDAISLLDQLSSTGQAITLEMAHNVLGTAASQSVLNIVDALQAKDAAGGLDYIHRALDSGSDPRQFARQLVDYLRDLLLIRMDNAAQVDATSEVRAQMARHAQGFSVAELLRVIRVFNHAANEARATWQPSLPLEMAFVEALQPPPEPAVTALPTGPASMPGPHPGAGPRVSQTAAPQPARPRPSQAAAAQPSTPPEEPQPPAAEAPGGGEPGPADSSLLKRLLDQWQTILTLIRQRSPNTYGLINSVKSRTMRNNIVILGFASELLKFQMEKEANLTLAQEVISQVMGQEINIRCVTTTSKNTTLPPNVDSDGMVAAALNELGGEIVDIQ